MVKGSWDLITKPRHAYIHSVLHWSQCFCLNFPSHRFSLLLLLISHSSIYHHFLNFISFNASFLFITWLLDTLLSIWNCPSSQLFILFSIETLLVHVIISLQTLKCLSISLRMTSTVLTWPTSLKCLSYSHAHPLPLIFPTYIPHHHSASTRCGSQTVFI